MGHAFSDMIVSDHGTRYAIGGQGVLYSFDADFVPSVVAGLPSLEVSDAKFLMDYRSDLYVVSTICDEIAEGEDERTHEEGSNVIPLDLIIYIQEEKGWFHLGGCDRSRRCCIPLLWSSFVCPVY